MPNSRTPTHEVDVVVIGAGFAGLYAIHSLREQGFSLKAFESGSSVGGTWFWNTVPRRPVRRRKLGLPVPLQPGTGG